MNYPDSVNASQIDDATKPIEMREYDALISDESQWLLENKSGEDLFYAFMNARHDSLLVNKIQDALELATETKDMLDVAIQQFDLWLERDSKQFALNMDILVRGNIDDQWTRITANTIGTTIESVVSAELKSEAEYNYSNNCLKHGV